jgi:hypothetical protein
VRARFSAPVQTGTEASPLVQRVPGFCLGVKRSGRGVNHPLLSSAEVKDRVELHFYYPVGLHGLF